MDISLLIWNAVLTVVLLYVLYRVTQWQQINSHLVGLARRGAQVMNEASVESRRASTKERIKEEHKGAFLDSLAAEIPFAKNVIDRMRDGGMGDNEILVMLSDPDILNGIVRVAQGAGVVVDSLKGLIGGGDKDKPKGRARQSEIPLIETKA